MARSKWVGILALAISSVGCDADVDSAGMCGATDAAPWIPVTSTVAACAGAPPPPDPEMLATELASLDDLSTEELLAAHNPTFEALSYDPLEADLSLIQASGIALDEAELARLASDGFVVVPRLSYPTFGYGYETVYGLDLPVYISADSILYALHRSFSKILQAIETGVYMPALHSWTTGVRARLASCGQPQDAQAARDVDLFLTVTATLLEGNTTSPVAGADSSAVADLVGRVQAAGGLQTIELFGESREIDFSQFTLRGHYTDSPELGRYFAAMMWLGTVDFRLLAATYPSTELTFRRRELNAAALLYSLASGGPQADYELIHRMVGQMIGPPDDMSLPQVGSLLADLDLPHAGALQEVDDATVEAALIAGHYGEQSIGTGFQMGGVGAPTEQPRSLRVFGQRFVADANVLSDVVYDRVQPSNDATPLRMMPNPLDVAFAALGNDHAAQLLASELDEYQYAENLAGARVVANAHACDLWKGSLYHGWLDALRGLSPPSAWPEGTPNVAKTERWGRRILASQLASWAELRHDTVLYAKQSYSSGDSCEFPDGYVDPYPAFYQSIQEVAKRGREIAASVEDANLQSRIDGYFVRLGDVAAQLEAIATRQLEGLALTEEQLAFINDTVELVGCGAPTGLSGWYGGLFFDETDAVTFDPTIADVHTQPTLEGGAPVGRVLHVGTGNARTMVVTVDTCTGPRAYVGPVSSYYEVVTENYKRLTDDEWALTVLESAPVEPSWLSGITFFE